MRIQEITATNVIAQLPRLQPVGDDSALLGQAWNVLIVANGFEDRASSVAQRLAGAGATVDLTIVLEFTTNKENNAARRAELDEAIIRLGGTSISLDGGCADHVFDQSLARLIGQVGDVNQVSVVLDVSGCSGRFILRVLRVLFELSRSSRRLRLDVFYTQAMDYAPTPAVAEKLIADASNGEPVATTLGLDFDADDETHLIERPGQQIDPAPERALVICGFNADRVRASLDRIDTSFNVDVPHPSVTYVAGRPPREEDEWRLDAMIRINSAGDADHPIQPKITSTLNYEETLGVLEAEYERAEHRYRLTVLPFGSKMQSIAVALFCEAHPDVRVQMLAPTHYRGVEYSRGIRQTHLLPLGDLSEISDALAKIGSVDLSEAAHNRPRNPAVSVRVSYELEA
ncbi:hypothetical protein ASE14_09595 [Agromyces sp. Root81]|uniref:hypothetical protein n=1 Tax=Agromyces sp. Root81 TaxID=1736601 RepID=UPI0006FE47CA|nr:hypothetical protein [Agromyces sp. Root81]KRC61172.1 hypothetical protein ASE14_09595 [Agromyces sp. Root81]